ncbi:MAG: alpha/beta hydrolase-fold protein, partial [Solirubrobacteraceae bacterium]
PSLYIGGAGLYGYWQAYYVHRGFEPVRALPHSGHGHNRVVYFYSKALHRQFDYRVFLPAGYNPKRHRYPVYYLLHGSPGRPQAFIAISSMGVRMDNLIAKHQAQPMILVFPDGRIGGSTYSDSEWSNTPSGAYDNYVVDVVHDVDHRFATRPARRYRVIAGFSAGAYGALNVALHHIPVFGDVQAWSAYFVQHRTGVFANATQLGLEYNSPLYYVHYVAPVVKKYPLRAYMIVGRGDHGSRQIAQMAAAMQQAGIDAAYHIYAGGHDWELWNAHINGMIIRASRAMLPPNTPVGPIAPPVHHRRSVHQRAKGYARVSGSGAHHRLRLLNARAGARARGGTRPAAAHGQHHRQHARAPTVVAPLPLEPLPRSLLGARHQRQTAHPRQTHVPALPAAKVIIGLLLALVSAALINLGFLFQHQGLEESGGEGFAGSVRGAIRSRTWLGGQVLGWVGFLTQIVAVVVAPLSLVQAFAAGGLALSVPLSAVIFGHRIVRGQMLAVLVIAAGLASLPIATPVVHEHLTSDRMMLAAIVAVAVATVLATSGAGVRQAVAAGIFYGVADAAIKAIAVLWSAHHAGTLLSGWTGLAAVGTFLGFLTFQTALRSGGAVSSISLMNAFAALVALGCGLLAFGESLGRDPLAVAGHVVAIGVVLLCVPPLAAAQEQIATADRRRVERRRAAEARRRAELRRQRGQRPRQPRA